MPASLPAGSTVTVTAIPDASVRGARFVGWSHPGCPGRKPTCTLRLRPGPLALYASFDPVLLRVGGTRSALTLDPPTAPCRLEQVTHACVFTYPLDTKVTLTSDAGGPIAWDGDCKTATPTTCTLRLYENRFVAPLKDYVPATYAPSGGSVVEGIKLVYSGPRGGTIATRSLTDDGPAQLCQLTCTIGYADGDLVQLRAKPGPGVRFVRWTDIRARSGVRRFRMGTLNPIRAIFARR